ncbi:polysaccharide biosynthesis/export family protein [Novosphingobium colocasiae]|uniref:polysaccharide biosynthesis/export family protein n=1 Tax=Novosphingobium colocasiae TaxID=1256513 RepID=UPI0035ADDD65
MRIRNQVIAALMCVTALQGCAGSYRAAPTVARGSAGREIMDNAARQIDAQSYRINVDDTLSVNVFLEPDLSVPAVKVDRSGDIALPAIGSIKAEGRTIPEMTSAISTALKGRYLRDPRVSVGIVSSSRDKVVVTGQVTTPGVYDMRKGMTLLEALAVAAGETDVSRLEDVVVYRTVNGERMAAAFNVAAMMSGTEPDLALESNDMVVVGYSGNRAFWKAFRESAGIMALFIRFAY